MSDLRKLVFIEGGGNKKSGSGDRSQGTKSSARTSWRIEGRDDVQQKQLEGDDNIYKDEEEQKNSNRMEQGEDEDRRGSNLKISNEVVKILRSTKRE